MSMNCSPRPLTLLCWVCLALLVPSVGTAQEKDPLKLDNVPTFDSTSNDPILMRYKLKSGQVEKLVVDIDMDMKFDLGGQKLGMKMNMKMEAKAAVTAVDG